MQSRNSAGLAKKTLRLINCYTCQSGNCRLAKQVRALPCLAGGRLEYHSSHDTSGLIDGLVAEAPRLPWPVVSVSLLKILVHARTIDPLHVTIGESGIPSGGAVVV